MLTVTSWVEGAVKEALPQAVAWFPPLPPAVTVREVAVRVSPAPGQRGVDVTKSMFREPTTQMCGWEGIVFLMPILKVGVVCCDLVRLSL
jgi:hypothetical protein